MKRDLQLDFNPATLARPDFSRQWSIALLLLVFALVWLIGWYGSTAKSMADTWARSDTFAHGYIVPLIALWLAWRKRDELATLAPRPSWWVLAPVTVMGFAWLLGELAAVNAVSQLALTVLLILTVVAVLGRCVAQKLAFPLAFLLFAVPIGEFIMPYLMVWTADFTVAALRLTGIPVYREGQQLVIPTGVWSVVEACSGLRYLIASLMIGTLFAHLMYRSLKRRLMFVVLSIVVPIVANWLRAYMIVMLGHLSGNKLAVGVDHLIYGWLFFGVVIACLFAIGARWREDHLPPPIPSAPIADASTAVPVRRLVAASAAVALLAVIWKVGYLGIDSSNAASRPSLASLGPTQPWEPVSDSFMGWRPHFVSPSAELQRTFRDGPRRVGLYVSYYRNQDYESKLVSSENKLVKSDDHVWLRTAEGTRSITVNGQPLAVRTTLLRGVGGQELLVWQWYWINGRLTASDHWAKGFTALSRLRGHGDDSAAIVVYTTEGRTESAEKALEAFVGSAAAPLEAALRQTRNRR
jgi:exosortase A